MDTDNQPLRGSTLLAVFLLLLSLVPIVLWPLETCWCIDEPQLITHAFRANEEHGLYITGLFGNFALPYGPVPTQIYQLILTCTHDPATIILVRSLLCSLVTGLSLIWLARSLGMPQWFAASFLFAPYVSEQMRVLWDASFTIPIGSLALASFAAFVRHGRKWPLRFAIGGAAQILLIHPMSIPLAFPILGTILWKYRPALWRDLRGLAWTAGILILLHTYYFGAFYYALMWKLDHSGMTTYPKGASHMEAALAPFYGGNIFSGMHALPFPAPWYLDVMARLTLFIYVLIWVGIAAALYCSYFALRASARGERPATLQTVCSVGLAGLLIQGILYGTLRIPAGPQYYFGTFALHAFFALMGVTAFAWLGRAAARDFRADRGSREVRLFRVLGVLPGVYFLVVSGSLTATAVVYKHQHADDAPVWPTMKMATDIVHELNRYDQLGAYSDIDYLNITLFKYPQAIRAVRMLLPADESKQIHPKGKLFITFHKKEDGQPSGKIEVVDLGDQPLPPNSYYFGTGPLSELWFPDPSTW